MQAIIERKETLGGTHYRLLRELTAHDVESAVREPEYSKYSQAVSGYVEFRLKDDVTMTLKENVPPNEYGQWELGDRLGITKTGLIVGGEYWSEKVSFGGIKKTDTEKRQEKIDTIRTRLSAQMHHGTTIDDAVAQWVRNLNNTIVRWIDDENYRTTKNLEEGLKTSSQWAKIADENAPDVAGLKTEHAAIEKELEEVRERLDAKKREIRLSRGRGFLKCLEDLDWTINGTRLPGEHIEMIVKQCTDGEAFRGQGKIVFDDLDALD